MPRLIKVAVAEDLNPERFEPSLAFKAGALAALSPPRTSVAGRIRVARAATATDSTIGKQPTPTRDRAPVSGTDRPAQCPQTRVSLIFECRGMRLWHPGSAHRGVHGDTSRAIVSLPSHEVMVCETSSDGPPHVSQKWSGSG